MATYNVELRQRISGTFGDTIYLKANWNNLDNKPSTFTPTAHTHGNVSNDGKIGSTAGLIIKTGTSGLLEALAAGSSGQFLGHDGTWKDLPASSPAELVDVEATYGEPIESTYGEFAPLDGGVPLVTEIQGMLLDAPQLVTNGDFSVDSDSDGLADGFTIYNATPTFITNLQSFVATWQYGSLIHKLPLAVNNKYYYHTRFNASSINVYLFFGDDTYFTSTQIATHSAVYQYETFSGLYTTPSQINQSKSYISIRDAGISDWNNVDVSYLELYNVSTLQANKQYSPMFNTTFDLMSDAQIKAQMDLWVQDGTLPDGIKAVSNTSLQSVGKNLFDKSEYATDYAYKIKVKPSTAYIWSASTAYRTYDINMVEVASATGTTVTTGSGTHYIAFSGIASVNAFQLELGTTATAYEPYKSATQTFTHGPLYRLPNGVYDSIEYRNSKYYKVQRVKKYTLQASDINYSIGTNVSFILIPKPTNYIRYNQSTAYLVPRNIYFEGLGLVNKYFTYDNRDNVNYIYTWNPEISYDIYFIVMPLSYTEVEAKADLEGTDIYYQLATPIETEITDVDGLLLQDDVTTIYQLQDLATTYKVQFALNTEQTVKTLVERDRLQQGEIDSNEDNIVTLTARKTTTNDIIIMSETAWSTYTQVTGEVYGVYNETTFVITWYYGQTE